MGASQHCKYCKQPLEALDCASLAEQRLSKPLLLSLLGWVLGDRSDETLHTKGTIHTCTNPDCIGLHEGCKEKYMLEKHA